MSEELQPGHRSPTGEPRFPCQTASHPSGDVPVSFSAKTAYGLVALIELAGVHAAGGTLQVGEIARRQGIPDRYLEQMLTSLRKAGILRSLRGPRGGFQLARQPAKVTVAEVLAGLEGDAQPERQGDRSSDEFCPVTIERLPAVSRGA